jgi:hypothetical protein
VVCGGLDQQKVHRSLRTEIVLTLISIAFEVASDAYTRFRSSATFARPTKASWSARATRSIVSASVLVCRIDGQVHRI